MKKLFDILGLGCTAIDEILYVSKFPAADSKVEVRQSEKHCGGLCATALVTGARLGARCAYAGTLGDGADSDFVRDIFRREGVNTRFSVLRSGKGPVRSTIIVDIARHTRTILYSTRHAQGADDNRPTARIIAASRVLLVDRFGLPGMLRAARIARSRQIPIVGDFESHPTASARELIGLTDHLIVSADFGCALTGARSAANAADRLWKTDRAVVIVTTGENGCWLRDGMGVQPLHFPAFRVKAVDTTGCGDVFHGAYAAALAWGWPTVERIRFASATAALKATVHGGQSGIPSRSQVLNFLKNVSGQANE